MTQQGGSSYLLCYHAQYKAVTEITFLAFLQHFVSLPLTPVIYTVRDTSSLPPWSATFPRENKVYEEGGSREQITGRRRIYIGQWVIVVLLARPARIRLAGSSTTVFFSNAFGSAMSPCIKVVNTELFLKGAS